MSVRWDAVVDKSLFWTDPPPRAAAPSSTAADPAARVPVKVWLYGSLASLLAERPLELQFPAGFSVADVLAELGRRCGKEFSESVLGADGRKFSHCRVYVDGFRADDLQGPVHAGPSPAVVEIILLAAIEGG
ncbi:MAG: MoaD/ThiS family protein [Betaproteobacteria bacterium]|nr:MoaD/ThiS family protein [Betaproteobacteria bacterium]